MFTTQIWGTVFGAFINYVVMVSVTNRYGDLLADSNGSSTWSGANYQAINANATTWALAKYLYASGGRYVQVPAAIGFGFLAVCIHRLIYVVSRVDLTLIGTDIISGSRRLDRSTSTTSTSPSSFLTLARSPVSARAASSSPVSSSASTPSSTSATTSPKSSPSTRTSSPRRSTVALSSCCSSSRSPSLVRATASPSTSPSGGATSSGQSTSTTAPRSRRRHGAAPFRHAWLV